jgi:hypothetical protein
MASSLSAGRDCRSRPLVLRFDLSYRDIEELLTERGAELGHVTRLLCVVKPEPGQVEAAGNLGDGS